MSSKDVAFDSGLVEKGQTATIAGTSEVIGNVEGPARHADFMTRNGLSLESFKKAHYGTGIVELERPMSARHLNMIAIGGSIGAGFFVGSGGALSKGVSRGPSISLSQPPFIRVCVKPAWQNTHRNISAGPWYSFNRLFNYWYNDVQCRYVLFFPAGANCVGILNLVSSRALSATLR